MGGSTLVELVHPATIMACDDEIIPLYERVETVADDTDLEEVYNMERHGRRRRNSSMT